MHTGAIDNAIVVLLVVFDACLCAVLIGRKRWKEYPALFGLVFLDLIAIPVLYEVARSSSLKVYSRVYLAEDSASFLFQIWILYEVAKQVLRPAGIWIRGALKPLLLMGSAGALVALIVTSFLQPTGLRGHHAFELRADMFTGFLTCELVIAMMISAKEVGLGWRNHVMAVGQGLMFWSLTVATLEGVSIYFGPQNPYLHAFYYIRVIAYLAVLSYWTVSLWHNEPARKPISPALRKYVLALHERVHYDLGKVGH